MPCLEVSGRGVIGPARHQLDEAGLDLDCSQCYIVILMVHAVVRTKEPGLGNTAGSTDGWVDAARKTPCAPTEPLEKYDGSSDLQ